MVVFILEEAKLSNKLKSIYTKNFYSCRYKSSIEIVGVEDLVVSVQWLFGQVKTSS